MKGVFIQSGFEVRLDVHKDAIRQGDILPCTLSVKNRNPSPREIPGLRLELAAGVAKKVKEKSKEAFETVAVGSNPGPSMLAQNEERKLEHTFPLDINCPITDKTGALYILYGLADSETLGELMLTVEPHTYIEQILGILQSSFQFILKGVKASHGTVQAKLTPPSAKRFSMVDDLYLSFRFDGEILELRFLFKVKKFAGTGVKVSFKKGEEEVIERLEPSAYLLTSTHVNHQYIEDRVEEAVKRVATGF